MNNIVSEAEARKERILDAASQLFIHHGFDKTTIGDIASEVGISRGLVYLIFKNKDEILDALLVREVLKYSQAWLDYIERDPNGGTVAATYRGVLYALNSNPLMAAIVKRDKHIFGNYLRKPGNIFEAMQSNAMMGNLLQAMQDAGAVRKDINVAAMNHIMDILSFGLVGLTDIKTSADIPPFDDLIETIAEMLDRMLTPEGGGNREAGKAILLQLGTLARAQFEQMKKASSDQGNEHGIE